MKERFVLLRRSIVQTTLVLGFLLFSFNLSQAQETFLLKGRVIDSISKSGVPFASVHITPIQKQNILEVVQQMADDKGNFELSLPQALRYRIEAKFVGKHMKTYTLTYQKLRAQKEFYIAMADDAEELRQVTVTAARPLVRMDVDRLAYNVKDDPMSGSENLQDMLRKVPLVTVDGEGNIQVRGRKDFAIYLNGKPSRMLSSNPKEVLQSIPAKTIKSIEVITEPGVRYDAEGVGAILNIITERAILDGYQGNISLSGSGVNPQTTESAFFTTKSGKLGITANVSHFFRINQLVNENLQHGSYKDAGFDIDIKQYGEPHKHRFNNFTGDINLTYDFNKYNLLSLSASTRIHPNSNLMRNIVETKYSTKEGNLLHHQRLVIDHHNGRSTTELRADYEHTTDLKGESLTLSTQWVYDPYQSHTHSKGTTFTSSPVTEGLQRSQTRGFFNEFTLQADYVRPLGEEIKVEGGLKSIFRGGNTHSLFEIFDSTNNQWKEGTLFGQNQGLSGKPMLYKQNIYAAYANATWRPIQPLSLSLGGRAEMGFVDVSFKDHSEANLKHKFLDLVPQFITTYQVNMTDQIKMSYHFRVKRPNLEQLNPYREQISKLLVQYGNPNLTNPRRHSIRLEYAHYTSTFNVSLATNFNFSNNRIYQYFFTLTDKEGYQVINQSYSDQARSREVLLSLFSQYVPKPWVRIFLQGSAGYHVMDPTHIVLPNGAPYNNPIIKGYSYNGYLGSTFTLPKEWAITVGAGLYRSEPELNIPSVSVHYDFFNVTKSLFKKRVNATFYTANLTAPWQTVHGFISFPGYEGAFLTKNSALAIGFHLSYNFGNLKSNIRKVSRTIRNDDLLKEEKGQQQGGAMGGN